MDPKNSLTTQDSGLAVFDATALNQAYEFSEKLAKSSIVPNQLRGKPADIMVVLQTGIEMGLSPMMSLRSVDVIHGTPALKPQTMLALIRSRFPKALIDIKDDGVGTATVRMARDRDYPDEGFTSVWTTERAQTMGLLSKDNWKKQKITMLRWRAVGEAARLTFPDLLMGLYSSQEVQDYAIDPNAGLEDFDLKQDVADAKTELAKPEDVSSKSSEEDIVDAQFKEVDDNQEALIEAKIIAQIENRDYIFPLGEFKGKKLHEVEIGKLRDYLEKLETAAKASTKKMSEAQSALIANLSAYVSIYNKFEAMSPLELERAIKTAEAADQVADEPETAGGHKKETTKAEDGPELLEDGFPAPGEPYPGDLDGQTTFFDGETQHYMESLQEQSREAKAKK